MKALLAALGVVGGLVLFTSGMLAGVLVVGVQRHLESPAVSKPASTPIRQVGTVKEPDREAMRRTVANIKAHVRQVAAEAARLELEESQERSERKARQAADKADFERWAAKQEAEYWRSEGEREPSGLLEPFSSSGGERAAETVADDPFSPSVAVGRGRK